MLSVWLIVYDNEKVIFLYKKSAKRPFYSFFFHASLVEKKKLGTYIVSAYQWGHFTALNFVIQWARSASRHGEGDFSGQVPSPERGGSQVC